MAEQHERGNGIGTKLDRLIEVLEPKKKGKKFRYPKIKKAKLRMNYVLVIYIMDNLNVEMEYTKINNEYIYIRKTNTFHLATSKYVMNYKGIPVIIQPVWSLKPITADSFCPSEHYQKTLDANEGSEPQKVLIKLMELSNLKIKGKLGGKMMIWVIIGAIAVLYLVSQILGKGG